MMIERDDVEVIETIVAARLRELHMPVGRDGIVVTGSYDPKDGTVKVTYCDTAGMFPDTPDKQIDQPRIPLLTPHNGEQSGPRGGERVIVLAAQGGPVAILHHEEDDSPGAPSGEKWTQHKNASGTVDAYQKFTNDGTSGDGLGGLQHLAGSFYKLLTSGGWTFSLDDTGKKGVIASPGGLTITIDDNNGTITLGSGDDPGAPDALIRKSDLDNALSSQMNQLKTDLTTWASTHLQPGSGASGPTTLTPVTSTGSSKVQSA